MWSHLIHFINGGGFWTNSACNFTLQPDITVTRKLGRIGVQALIGYNFTIVKGKMFLENDDNAYLNDKFGRNVRASWDGGRVALGVSYFLDNYTE